MSLGPGVALAAASVANELGLAGNGGACGETLEAYVVRCVNRLLVKLGKEDVRDGADDAFGSALDQIGEADEDLAFAQTDGGVERSESAEPNRDGRNRRSRAQYAIFLFKDRYKFGGHQI